ERRAHGAADRGDRGQLGRLAGELVDDERVEVVPQDDLRLGREVAEERALRHLGGRGDLLDGRLVVALLAEQRQGSRLDRGPGPGLLALAQAVRRQWRRAARAGR